MGIDMNGIVRIIRRWWWIILLGPLLGGGVAYVASKSQQPMFRATTTLWVQTSSGANGFDSNEIQANVELAETLRHLVTVESSLSPVIADLRLPLGVDELRKQLSVGVIRGTPLIEVTAQDAQPERAAAIADAVAHEFGDSISQFGIRAMPAPSDADAEAAASSVNVVVVPAEVPKEPFAPRTTLFALVGALLGLLIVVGGLSLAELLSRRSAISRRQVGLSDPTQSPTIRQALGTPSGRH
jgi:succinoglycan biosynthesis transport protein ExoP